MVPAEAEPWATTLPPRMASKVMVAAAEGAVEGAVAVVAVVVAVVMAVGVAMAVAAVAGSAAAVELVESTTATVESTTAVAVRVLRSAPMRTWEMNAAGTSSSHTLWE